MKSWNHPSSIDFAEVRGSKHSIDKHQWERCLSLLLCNMNPLFIIVCNSHPVYGMFELDLNSFQAQHWLFTVFSWELTRHIWAYLGACWDNSRIMDTSVWTPCLPTAPMKYKAHYFILLSLQQPGRTWSTLRKMHSLTSAHCRRETIRDHRKNMYRW